MKTPYAPHARSRIATSCLAVAIALSLSAECTARSAQVPQRFQSDIADLKHRLAESWQRQKALIGTHGTPVRPSTTLEVTSCADDGSAGTLRTVLGSAVDGDIIDMTQLACSTISLETGAIVTPPPASNLTLLGPGRNALTIDGQNSGGVFYFYGGGTFTVDDMTIANGSVVDFWGGCISAMGGSVVLERTRVSSCTAHQITFTHGNQMGGAIMAFFGVAATDSEISGNVLSSDALSTRPYSLGVMGGGIFALAGDLSLTRSLVTGNQIIATKGGQGSAFGGGAVAYSGSVSIVDSVIDGNSMSTAFIDTPGYPSLAQGAGLNAHYAASLVIQDSTISNNTISQLYQIDRNYGAGVWCAGAAAYISGTTISGNVTSGQTGGLRHQGHLLRVANTTISGNTGSQGWGGLTSFGDDIRLTTTTIAFNHSDISTGGADLTHGGTLIGTIIANNTGGPASAADLLTYPYETISGDHNLLVDVDHRTIIPADTLRTDPLLAPLSDNGGGTLTHALQPGSPAIDAGSNPDDLPYDQRGTGFARVSGPAPDIGAFEVQQGTTDTIFANGFD